jgi:predicted ester cyclase
MSVEENVALVRRFMDVFGQSDMTLLDQIVADNWVNHDPSLPPLQGKAGARQLVALFQAGFPDVRVTVEDIFGAGDKVAFGFAIDGTNTGSLMDMAPTGKKVHVVGHGIIRVVDGKVTDNWVTADFMGLMQRLGVIPMPGQARA